MPMLVTIPRNQTVLRDVGSYVSGLNLLDRKQTAVQRQVRRAGLAGYEPETQATLLTLVQLSRRPAGFFDVGAHIGIYSALIAAVFPPDLVHVTAFEPTPATAAVCRSLADKNRLDMRIEPLALSSTEGTATLFISDKAETSNSLVAGFRPSSQRVEVPMTTLDAYCRANGVLPTVLKIDVETYEVHVLRGALGVLADARPAVVCELLPAAAPEQTSEVLDAMAGIGYQVHRWEVGAGWRPCHPDEVLSHVNGAHRDWLFTPGPLDDRFETAFAEWSTAIAECTHETNTFVPGGAPAPAGWGDPYEVEFQGR